ncbi:MAG: MBL fold metallo-hydrolase [Candidatus Rifleibacteriota bacterium]
MIGITFIGSGSKGNAALIELGNRLFLLDAGFSCRRIKEFLQSKNLDFHDLSGIFVTHEHEDHVKGLRVILSKNPKLPLLSTKGTYCALKTRGIEAREFIELQYGREFEIWGTRCFPFKVPHDAIQPMGLRFENGGKVMSIATDLGHITSEVLDNMKDADILCLESNYDEDLLRSSIYPAWLKRRIRSPMGHLPNEGVRGILSRMTKSPQILVLMHVSQESNTPELVKETVENFFELNHNRYSETRFSIALQAEPGERLFLDNLLPAKLKQKMIYQSTFDSFWNENAFRSVK